MSLWPGNLRYKEKCRIKIVTQMATLAEQKKASILKYQERGLTYYTADF